MIPKFELLKVAQELCARYDCLLFGSLGLELTCPEVLDDEAHDADFYADAKRNNLMGIIGCLKRNGYEVFSWQDPIGADFDLDKLKGRFYFRGVKFIPGFEPAVIDVTYEIRDLVYNDLALLTTRLSDIRILNRQGFILALSKAEKAKHRREYRLLSQMENELVV